MANRCTGDYVKGIVTTGKTVAEVENYIRTANLIVTDALGDEGLSAAILKEIEAYLAAHLVACDDPAIAEEKTSDTEARYHGKSGLGLDFSPYGQQVKILDSTGKLVNRGKRSAKMEALF